MKLIEVLEKRSKEGAVFVVKDELEGGTANNGPKKNERGPGPTLVVGETEGMVGLVCVIDRRPNQAEPWSQRRHT